MTMVSEVRSINPNNSQFFQLPAMPTADKLSMKKLKIKISRSTSTTEVTEAEPKRSSCLHSCSLNRQSVVFDEASPTIISGEEKGPIVNKLQRKANDCFGQEDDMITAEKSRVQLIVNRASKRGPVRNLDSHNNKKRRIEGRITQRCAELLRMLMSDRFGWVFNQPVDPVKLQIPDYFTIITRPMDLGTIKSKLQRKLYACPEEFAADVRLTFSNAMLYNPPGNDVHIMAKKLSDLFESRWSALEAKWSVESSSVGPHKSSREGVVVAHEPQVDHKMAANSGNLPTKVLITSAQKQKLKKDVMELSSKFPPPQLLHYLRRSGLIGQNDEISSLEVDDLDDKTVFKLQGVIKNHLRSKPMDSDHTETTCGQDFLQKDLHRGTDNINGHSSGSLTVKSLCNPSACVSGSCGTGNSNRHNDFIEASSEVDSAKSSGRDNIHAFHVGASNQDSLVDHTASRQMRKLDPQSDGAVSAVDDSSSRPATPLTTTTATISASGEGWENSIYDGQLSPSKALRAAMLRSRFAGLIVKAEQKALLNNGEKIDLEKMKKEKERLEKRQREEKARIEAKIRADEAALRMREEAAIKKQREREREAARIALEKMEKTVEICENLQVLKDLEKLAGDAGCFLVSYQSSHCRRGGGVVDIMLGSSHVNPLERLGLFLKEEYVEEEEVLKDRTGTDVEEGEIA